MTSRQECPNCKVTLRLPESGVGRCPKCKTIVRAEPDGKPAAPSDAEALSPVIPEISAEDEVAAPEETRFAGISIGPIPHKEDYVPMPPPLPRSGRRGRTPAIDIANPPPPASKTAPITLLTLAFVVSLLAVIGSFIFLVAKAREHRPAPPPIIFPRR